MQRYILITTIICVWSLPSFGYFPIADANHTWFVAADGSDTNGGRATGWPVQTASIAKLTIAATVTAAADGDTIIIYPGTYSEQVDCLTDANSFRFIGTNKNNTIITHNGTVTVAAYRQDEFYNLTIKNTSASGKGLSSDSDANGIRIENCWIEGPQGIQVWEGRNLIVKDSTIKGSIIAVSLKRSYNTVFENTHIWCLTTTAVDSKAIIDGATADTSFATRPTTAVYRNCTIESYRNDDNHNDVYAAQLRGYHAFENCHIGAFITETAGGDSDPASNGNIYGVFVDSSYTGNVMLLNSTVRTKNNGSGSGSNYDLYNDGSGSILVNNCFYTKSYGKITNKMEIYYDVNGRNARLP